MLKRLLTAAILAGIFFTGPVMAGNENANPCGNNGNNCNPSGGAGGAGGAGGNGYGGSAIATGGYSDASIGDIRNTAAGGSVLGSGNSTNSNVNTALGGQGGIGLGGSAAQQQGQGQQQSNVGINGQGQSSTNANTLGQDQSTAVDASSKNDNRSTAQGNLTNVGPTTVGGQQAENTTNVSTSYVSQRNAPPVYLGNITATMSCTGSFQAGGSQAAGSGAFGFTWISGDCRTTVAADKFRELGMIDTACKLLKTTKGFKRAAKIDASLRDVSCELAK